MIRGHRRLVDCLNAPEQFEGPRGSQDDIRIEAAQVLSSLSYGASHWNPYEYLSIV